MNRLSANESRWRARRSVGILGLIVGGLALAVTGIGGPASASGATAPRPALDHGIAGRGAVPLGRHDGGGTHRVVAGDTLSGIAARYGTTVSALVAANGLTDPDLIPVGATLSVPGAGAGGAGVGPGQPGTAGGVAAPGLPSRLAQSPTRLSYRPIFEHWANANGVPVDLLEAMTWLESGWQNGIVSPVGAMGIGQLMPATVEHMEALIGIDLDPAVPEDNIRLSARYLRWLLARFSTVESAVAAYYQGPSSIEARGALPETDDYVADVLALRVRF